VTVTQEHAPDLSGVFVVDRVPYGTLDGLHREAGEVLFTDGWLPGRAAQLVKVFVLRPAPYLLMDTITTCGCGRAWENAEAQARHKCSVVAPASAEVLASVGKES
jgi:hypothetical protein